MSDPSAQHGTLGGHARPKPGEGPAVLDVDVVKTHTGVVHIRVAGEMDAYTCPILREQVFRYLRADARLLVDLQAVDFLGSAGIALLLDIDFGVREAGARWSVLAANRTVLRPLEATATAARLPLAGTVADGLRRVGPVGSR